MAQMKGPYGISRKLQELMCLMGQSQVFEDGENLFKEIMGISVSGKQIQRVSECYGECIEEKEELSIEAGEPAPVVGNRNDTTYVMLDGSMVFTREEGWKEIKVGRIFASDDCVAVQENRHEIVQSQYVCHLGAHQGFLNKMEYYTDAYKKKVCVADGAKWIWNWAEDTYPDMVQILDFYHAVEKIGILATHQFVDEDKRKRWLSKQKERLLNDKVEKVLAVLEQLVCRNQEVEKLRNDAIRYYRNNKKRMRYKTFKEAGYLIGSGAIESAHRNVVQQRLKLSGQRWSVKGAQQIVNLRAYQKSNRWKEVIELIKKAA